MRNDSKNGNGGRGRGWKITIFSPFRIRKEKEIKNINKLGEIDVGAARQGNHVMLYTRPGACLTHVLPTTPSNHTNKANKVLEQDRTSTSLRMQTKHAIHRRRRKRKREKRGRAGSSTTIIKVAK
eukprot:TRINITY_DN11756_c0_g2_i1.p1 TRINITY_DN11756_c0_g2~~TRINITY_DN11756_c0_g2_i1.p1  ORF type:complete len:125 (-),score=6.08 TRINITY_DN11756_c0_g2_i1:142-516(-)